MNGAMCYECCRPSGNGGRWGKIHRDKLDRNKEAIVLSPSPGESTSVVGLRNVPYRAWCYRKQEPCDKQMRGRFSGAWGGGGGWGISFCQTLVGPLSEYVAFEAWRDPNAIPLFTPKDAPYRLHRVQYAHSNQTRSFPL